jgi:hypothetical protein
VAVPPPKLRLPKLQQPKRLPLRRLPLLKRLPLKRLPLRRLPLLKRLPPLKHPQKQQLSNQSLLAKGGWGFAPAVLLLWVRVTRPATRPGRPVPAQVA